MRRWTGGHAARVARLPGLAGYTQNIVVERAVGGRTNTWGRSCFRHGPLDFQSKTLQGYAEDWPITYEELTPYYDKAERPNRMTLHRRHDIPAIVVFVLCVVVYGSFRTDYRLRERMPIPGEETAQPTGAAAPSPR